MAIHQLPSLTSKECHGCINSWHSQAALHTGSLIQGAISTHSHSPPRLLVTPRKDHQVIDRH